MKNNIASFCNGCKEESCSKCGNLAAYIEGIDSGIDEVLLLLIRNHGTRIKELLRENR